MYGGDEPSTSSTSAHNQISQQHEVNVDEYKPSKTKKKTKDPAPIISITKPTDSNSSKTKEFENNSKIDSVFGLSTIKENHDPDDNLASSKQLTDDELDFDNYFNKIEQKKTKKPAPILQQAKESRRSLSRSDEIRTPATSISLQTNPLLTASTVTKQSESNHDSTDDDVDELLGNLEVRFLGKYTHTYIHILFPPGVFYFYLITQNTSVCFCMSVCDVFSP